MTTHGMELQLIMLQRALEKRLLKQFSMLFFSISTMSHGILADFKAIIHLQFNARNLLVDLLFSFHFHFIPVLLLRKMGRYSVVIMERLNFKTLFDGPHMTVLST